MRSVSPKGLAAFFFLIAALALIGPDRSAAQDSEGTKKKLDKIDSQIKAEQDRLLVVREKERSVFGEFQAIDNLYSLYSRKADSLRRGIDDINTQMQANIVEEERLNKIITAERKQLGKRFRSMYMQGPGSLIELALAADSFSDLSRREVYYKALAKADTSLIAEYRGNIAHLREVQKKLAADRQRMVALQVEVEKSLKEIEVQRKAKADLLRAVREDRDTHLQVINELEATSRRVGGVIARNERKEEERRLEAERIAASAATAGESGRATPEVGAAAVQRPTIIATAPESALGGFEQQRGRMCAPTVGSVVQGYGMQRNPRFGTQTFSKGIAIAAPSGTPIRAVWDGEVVYAGWFNGYGKILIVNHGDHYYTLYAHASTLLKGAGQMVKKGDVIARVGDTGSLEGPRVYFEVRKGSSPQNPTGWVRVGC